MSAARWTSDQLKAYQSAQLDRKIKRRVKTRIEKVDLFPLACLKMGLPEPVKEYRFHPQRRWRIDYYFEANGRKVGLEVEGGVWTGGRHIRGKGFTGDMEKYNAAAGMGITIVRVVPGYLLKIETFELIKKALYGTHGTI